MTTKLMIALGLALVVIGFMLGWWAHPDVPEHKGYNPPIPDSVRTEQVSHTVDSLSSAGDSLIAGLEKRDKEERARRVEPPPHVGANPVVSPLPPLPVPELARRDSVIRYLASPWIDYHRFEARKKDSTYIAGTVRIRVEPIRKATTPTVQIDSVYVLVPPPSDAGTTKTVLAWTAVALALGLIVGRIL